MHIQPSSSFRLYAHIFVDIRDTHYHEPRSTIYLMLRSTVAALELSRSDCFARFTSIAFRELEKGVFQLWPDAMYTLFWRVINLTLMLSCEYQLVHLLKKANQ